MKSLDQGLKYNSKSQASWCQCHFDPEHRLQHINNDIKVIILAFFYLKIHTKLTARNSSAVYECEL